jgi:hypothetical protein
VSVVVVALAGRREAFDAKGQLKWTRMARGASSHLHVPQCAVICQKMTQIRGKRG